MLEVLYIYTQGKCVLHTHTHTHTHISHLKNALHEGVGAGGVMRQL